MYRNAASRVAKDAPKNNFTIGINDDVTHTSLDYTEIELPHPGQISCKLWGLGGDGTVGANKNAISTIGFVGGKYAQAYFSYDTMKSGGLTQSHLRFGDEPILSTYLVNSADFVAVHAPTYVKKYDVTADLKDGGTFLLNTSWNQEELEEHLDGGGRRRGHTDVQQSDTGEQADEKYRRYPYQEGGCQTVEQGEAGAAAAAVKTVEGEHKGDQNAVDAVGAQVEHPVVDHLGIGGEQPHGQPRDKLNQDKHGDVGRQTKQDTVFQPLPGPVGAARTHILGGHGGNSRLEGDGEEHDKAGDALYQAHSGGLGQNIHVVYNGGDDKKREGNQHILHRHRQAQAEDAGRLVPLNPKGTPLKIKGEVPVAEDRQGLSFTIKCL